jgi:hypothetical protein
VSRATDRATDRATIANDGSHALTLILAPGGSERLLHPGQAVIVEAEGPAGSHAELLVERTCDIVSVWAWPGADVRLLAADGRVLRDWTGPPAPPAGAP